MPLNRIATLHRSEVVILNYEVYWLYKELGLKERQSHLIKNSFFQLAGLAGAFTSTFWGHSVTWLRRFSFSWKTLTTSKKCDFYQLSFDTFAYVHSYRFFKYFDHSSHSHKSWVPLIHQFLPKCKYWCAMFHENLIILF